MTGCTITFAVGGKCSETPVMAFGAFRECADHLLPVDAARRDAELARVAETMTPRQMSILADAGGRALFGEFYFTVADIREAMATAAFR